MYVPNGQWRVFSQLSDPRLMDPGSYFRGWPSSKNVQGYLRAGSLISSASCSTLASLVEVVARTLALIFSVLDARCPRTCASTLVLEEAPFNLPHRTSTSGSRAAGEDRLQVLPARCAALACAKAKSEEAETLSACLSFVFRQMAD